MKHFGISLALLRGSTMTIILVKFGTNMKMNIEATRHLVQVFYIFYATTFYLTTLDTYPEGPTLTLIICLKWLLVFVVVILIFFTYKFAVSCNFYNINWQICFKFVASHHSTNKFAKCFTTYNKYNKDIKWLFAYTSFYTKHIFRVNFYINFQICFQFNQRSYDDRVSLQCYAIFKMFYMPNTI